MGRHFKIIDQAWNEVESFDPLVKLLNLDPDYSITEIQVEREWKNLMSLQEIDSLQRWMRDAKDGDYRKLTFIENRFLLCYDEDNPTSQAPDLKSLLSSIREDLEKIVEAEGDDAGVIYLSHEAPTDWNEVLKCHQYRHHNFSPLGDALVALYQKIKSAEESLDKIKDGKSQTKRYDSMPDYGTRG